MGKTALERPTAATVSAMLAAIYDQRFGGKESGRYRISRKFLREIARRRRISDEFVAEITDELFEQGLVIVNVETYFAVLSQSLLNSYRHVTKGAIAQTLHDFGQEDPADPLNPENGQCGQGTDAQAY